MSSSTDNESMSSSADNEWLEQPVDPDPARDLGYDIVPWEVVTVDNGDSDHRVLLPTDDAMLKRDAFIIVPAGMVCELDEHL